MFSDLERSKAHSIDDIYNVPDETAHRTVRDITSQFSGGTREVGLPLRLNGESAAYTVEQASIVFENLMDMRVRDSQVPFLTVGCDNGQCTRRKDLMLRHMMYQQSVEEDALGIVIAKHLSPNDRNLVDYLKLLRAGSA